VTDAVTPNPALAVARDCLARGWHPVVNFFDGSPDGKKPAGAEWQCRAITSENVDSYFNGRARISVGVQLGAKSAGLADVDADSPEAVAIAPHFLPPTGSVFGRASTPAAHRLYYSDLHRQVDAAALQFHDPRDKTMIVELRVGGGERGAQTILPGNVHKPSGESIEWVTNGEPARVDGAALVTATRQIAALSLIASRWPGEGGRQHAALAVAGFLARAGWGDDDIRRGLAAIAAVAGDEEMRKRQSTANGAGTRLDEGKRTYGFPELANLIGSAEAEKVAEWLEYFPDRPAPAEELMRGDRPRLRVVPFNQLRPGTDPGYVVDGTIPMRGIVLVWGKKKCLKSFTVYDMCFHVARNMEYRGRCALGGPVFYCGFEAGDGYKKRAEAIRRHYNVPDSEDVPLYLVQGRLNMIKEWELLVSAVREHGGPRPRIIVLDTLNKSMVGSESKDTDMTAYVAAAEALRDIFDCVVIIVHHCGYDETHPRGHTSLAAAVDAEFEVIRDGALVTVRNVDMRDGESGFEIRSEAKTIDVGVDANGQVLTSLVVVPTEAPATAARKGRGRPNVGAGILIAALSEALKDRVSIFRPATEKAAVHAVVEEEVRRRFAYAYPAAEETQEKAAHATGEAFRRALQAAVADKKVSKGCDGQGVVRLWFYVAGAKE
jgi:hypothetical protein